jgi:hypothetical protein
VVLDLARSPVRGASGLWLLLLLRVRLRWLLGHHLAGHAHVLLEIRGHGDDRAASRSYADIPMRILAQAYDPAVPLVQLSPCCAVRVVSKDAGTWRVGLYIGFPPRGGRVVAGRCCWCERANRERAASCL